MEDDPIKERLAFLYQLLNQVTIGKVYYGINRSDEESHSVMPFIVYQEVSNRGMLYADDTTIARQLIIQITLVTEKKDPIIEQQLENQFIKNNLNYEMTTEYLNSDHSINRVYEIRMEVINNE